MTNILMSLWSGARHPTSKGVSLKAYTLIGVYAAGSNSKELFQGLIHDMHKIAHEDGMDMILCPLDYSSTRQHALPYWNIYSTEIVTVAKAFQVEPNGKVNEVENQNRMFENELEKTEEEKAKAKDDQIGEDGPAPQKIGYVRGFLDPRYMLL